MAILCFERRFSKQNSVIRLKSNILAHTKFFAPPNFSAGYATVSAGDIYPYVKSWVAERFFC